MTYHTAVRNQTAEVEAAIAVGGTLESLLDGLVARELALLDGLVDTDNILPYHASSANVQVADFGVTHQTLG